MVHGPTVAAATSENLLEMQILRPQARSTERGTQWVEPKQLCLSKPCRHLKHMQKFEKCFCWGRNFEKYCASDAGVCCSILWLRLFDFLPKFLGVLLAEGSHMSALFETRTELKEPPSPKLLCSSPSRQKPLRDQNRKKSNTLYKLMGDHNRKTIPCRLSVPFAAKTIKNNFLLVLCFLEPSASDMLDHTWAGGIWAGNLSGCSPGLDCTGRRCTVRM